MKQLSLGLLCALAVLCAFGLLRLVRSSSPLVAAPIAPTLKGELVTLKGKEVVPLDDTSIAKSKYFAIYYSASWCEPCRKFTPELVRWYNEQKPKHPEFELIFVGQDNDQESMETYMIEDQMPWPALNFPKIKTNKALTQYGGRGIPCLVFVDADGKVLADSFQGEEYLGPRHVLTEIDKALSSSTPSGF
jgi:nucleoredoxin